LKEIMATELTIDIEAILNPIADRAESPQDLRRQVRGIRDKLRETEESYNHFLWYGPEYEDQPAPAPPEWHALIKSASAILENESKDLWICAWLIEALTAVHGFAGLRDGYQITAALVERFWDSIEPSPAAEDGVEGTVKMIGALNESLLVERLNAIPVSKPASDKPALNCLTLKTAEQTAKTDFLAITPAEFFVDLTEDVAASIEAFEKLHALLREKCGDDAPPCAKIRESLQECQRTIRDYCKHLLPEDAVESTATLDEQQQVASGADNGDEVSIGTSHVANREEAFRVLEKIAEFFRRSEPHSPVSYALDQAVRWGRMPLPELLSELISDDSVRGDLFRRAGIREEDDS
jgi:type VI secretion system protein ImpA